MKEYNIGLDIGVGSVGWCVTDFNNNLMKYKGKNMWGSRIFEEASTAKERRELRCSRRRLTRRKERIRMLQNLLKEEIDNVDSNFLPRLKETSLDFEDKKISNIVMQKKYNLFSEQNYTDMGYYDQFPTIYHLRNFLCCTEEKADIRLVYLALHHIIKYRGNFLYDGDFSDNTNNVESELKEVNNYMESLDISLIGGIEEIINILKDSSKTKAIKKDEILTLFRYTSVNKQIAANIINAILGYSFDINKIFGIELDKSKICFKNEIENEDEIKDILSENYEIYENLSAIYSWYTLQDILKGNNSISKAMIQKYEKYNKDLKILKKIYRKYFPTEYKSMFKDYSDKNYVAYNGKSEGNTYKKCDYIDFSKTLKEKLGEIEEQDVKDVIKDIENENFLVKINVKDNGAIPHQLHQKELIKILENQSKYYDCLKENKERIEKIFSFKIPYYVGPLAKNTTQSKYAWVVRRSEEKIYPWNFKEIVDEDETAEKFINRMTNKCTYLLNEDVMPKQSLLYSKFCLLNELNNIRVNDAHIPRDMKEKIINELFLKNKKVTIKMFKEFYNKEGFIVESLSGNSEEDKFSSSLASYIDFKKIFGEIDESNINMCENLIYWITIFEDKKILKRKIKKEYPKLSDEQVVQISKLKYSGWSRLSKKLISGIKNKNDDSIMDILTKKAINFMSIINDNELGFKEKIESFIQKEEKNNITIKDINELPTSPANKRGIWQAICVVKEIVKIMRKPPVNIYIEFARSESKDKSRKDSRAKKLLKIYEDLDEQLIELKKDDNKVYSNLKKHQTDKKITEKLYLYFIQGGKCMYTGVPLNIDELSTYEVDHILPQSYIKDDSLDNKALVFRKSNQDKMDNLLLSNDVVEKMKPYWKKLLDNGLISQTKYYRLIRRKLIETDNDIEKFVQRQLVETRQIIKIVANLLGELYSDAKIYSLRANLTHDLRLKNRLYKNRNLNNFHHAQDAYLISYIGNIIDKKWYSKEEFIYGKYIKKYMEETKKHREEYGLLVGLINKNIDTEKLKKVMFYKDCFISRMLIEGTGMFYNQTLYSPKENPVIALKSDKDAQKYGGYSGENKAYCSIIKYKNRNGKNEYQLLGIPIKTAYDINNSKNTLENYIRESFFNNDENVDFEILKRKILLNQEYIGKNKINMRLCSDKEIRVNKELVVNDEISEFIYFMNSEENIDNTENQYLIERFNNTYKYLLGKLKREYSIFDTIYNKIVKVDFESLSYSKKRDTINGLIDLMQTGQGNLKSIGLSDREGRMKGKNLNTRVLIDLIFINKSVTGMYERRYSVNGMENNCS